VKKEMPTEREPGADRAPIPSASSSRSRSPATIPVLAEEQREEQHRRAKAFSASDGTRARANQRPKAQETTAIPMSTGRYRTFHDA
jgi:hypothetical protein